MGLVIKRANNGYRKVISIYKTRVQNVQKKLTACADDTGEVSRYQVIQDFKNHIVHCPENNEQALKGFTLGENIIRSGNDSQNLDIRLIS
jgi:hypothetical protein